MTPQVPPGQLNYPLKFPVELGEFFTQSPDKVEQLYEAHPWLRELIKAEDVDLGSLRHRFLTDGHTFMSILTEFLNAKKWQEFVITGALNDTYGVARTRLFEFVFRTGVRREKTSDDGGRFVYRPVEDLDLQHQNLCANLAVSDDGVGAHLHRLLNAVRLRCAEPLEPDSGCVSRLQRC